MPEAPREVDHTLPAVERVEHHRKAAKELLRAARAGEPDAVARLREALGTVPAQLRLADAQRAIAREHGHASWASFRRDLERQADEPDRSVARLGPVAPARFEGARRPAAAHAGQTATSERAAACERTSRGSPRSSDAALTERATIADARLVIAREHGFPTWRGLAQRTARGIGVVGARTPAPRAGGGGGDRDSRRGRRLASAPARRAPGAGPRRGGRGRLAARRGRANPTCSEPHSATSSGSTGHASTC